MNCSAAKAYETRVNTYNSNSKARKQVWQSKIEYSFLQAFKLKPGFACGKQIDGLDSKLMIAFEYDGWYYHKDKVEHDTKYTVKLLEAGYKVIRVRERSKTRILGHLEINHPRLMQYDYEEKVTNFESLITELQGELAQ